VRTTAHDRQPSLHQVAESAGVSVSTVSRYVNGQLALKPGTESRVLQAMESLGYVQSRRSRPRPAATGVIGLIVPNIGSMYFGRIAEALVAAADANGFSVLTASTFSRVRKENEYVELMLDKSVDAIVYAGNHTTNAALERVIAAGVPVVVIDEAIDGASVDTVLVDDYAGAYQAVTHLVAVGHRRIALLSGPRRLNSVIERTRGYREALERAGVDPSEQLVLSGNFSEDFGTGAVSHLLAADNPPTAVFAASDTIALGVLTGASNLGVRVPDDLSVIGFDDVPAAGYVAPRLTTVRTPVDRMAASAIAMLIERLADPGARPTTTVVPVALVLGETVAPPRS
jgi:DNA-binding LacI/PurR family transcriptional regulator